MQSSCQTLDVAGGLFTIPRLRSIKNENLSAAEVIDFIVAGGSSGSRDRSGSGSRLLHG